MPFSVTHDDKAQLSQDCCEVIRGACEVDHDRTVATLSQTDHLVVLADNLGCALGEIKGEAGLVCAEVVDVEDQFFGEVFW